MYDPYADFTKTVLPNGLEIHSVFWDRPWIQMAIVVHSGGREDPVTLPGLAHFVEHCVSENIPDRTLDEALEFFDSIGGGVELGATDYLATRYKFGVPCDHEMFREALTILGSMLIHAQLEKDIERERSVINREFNQRHPFPERIKWDMATHSALFPDHRLATYHSPLGHPEGFLAVTQADLQNFYDTHYVPTNMSLVIVGGISPERLIAEIEKSPFGSSKVGKRISIPPPLPKLAVPLEQTRTVRLSDYVSFKIDQTEYRATWAFPADFPHQARRVFDHILEKLLAEEIRVKRGLAYRTATNYTSFQDVYEYRIESRINPEATPVINELVRKCISMVSRRRDLFERKRRSLIQKCLMTDVSGASLCDRSAQDLVFRHRIVLLQEVRDELLQVQHEQMAEAADFLSERGQYTFIARP
jgi:predicted Zn-dependent peptidase